MSSTKFRQAISIETKLGIIEDLESGLKVIDICEKRGVNLYVVYRVKKNKHKIEEHVTTSCCKVTKTKKIKHSYLPNLEAQLFSWFLGKRARKDIVSNQLLQVKAKEIFRSLPGQKLDKFSASSGWLRNFKKRHGIRILSVAGEKLSCDESQIPFFIEKFQKIVQEKKYLPEQVYNCDESGLFLKSLPKSTNVASNEKTAPGMKTSKQRVTIMPCVNATGNHKLPLQLIGKAVKPRCFKDIDVPVYYQATKNAWQTTSSFKKWYDEQFVPEVLQHLRSKNLPEKALLILDNATCHGTELSLENDHIEILFLPKNTTAYLQPLDQHIIKSLKVRYRYQLLSTVGTQENTSNALKEVNLKDACFMATEAWNQVSKSTIINGFKHLYQSIEEIQFNLPAFHFDEEDDVPLRTLFNSLFTNEDGEDAIIQWAVGDDDPIARNSCDLQMDTDEDEPGPTEGEKEDLNKVIDAYNLAIEWAEKNDSSFQEILTMRRMRNRAVFKKIID